MSGALLQLAALGPQDVNLVGNPEITLFKSSYKRYTHFATETVIISFDGGTVNFGSDTESTASIEKLGDLISKMVLVVELEAITDENVKWGYVNKLGHAIIDEISVHIGQTEVDVHTGDWINLYYDLYANKSHDRNYNNMIGNTAEMKKLEYSHDAFKLFIPLNFWFTKSSSSSFPICSLDKLNFQIRVRFKNAIDCINYKGSTAPSNLPNINNAYFLVDYIFLQEEERQLFISNDHEYLIEQVQDMTETITTELSRINLIFDRPCKYLIWHTMLDRYNTRTEYLNWATDDNWDKVKENFAKLVWIATRENLYIDGSDNPYITLSNSVSNVNNSLPKVSNGLTKLSTLADKITALFLFATVDPDDNTQYLIDATIENIIILENNLTFEDVSNTIDELKENYDDTNSVQETQVAFMDLNKVSILDMFNTGNFINRKDNPIVSSRLQLNGKDRFQERDGVYFNYMVPYYYFRNTPADGVNIYSFSLNPIDIQPSGTINLGQVNTKELIIKLGKQNITTSTYFSNYFKGGTLRIFTYSYTLLRISPSRNLVGLTFV
jgi:hypothetical protein